MQNKTQVMKNLEVFQKYNINDKILLKDSRFCTITEFNRIGQHLVLDVYDILAGDYYTVDPDDVAMIVN